MELSRSKERSLHIKLKKSLFVYFPDNGVSDSTAKEASAVLYSRAQDSPSAGHRLVIDGPGEFEIDDLSVRGVDLNSGSGLCAYHLTSDAISIILLPPSASSAYTDTVLEAIGVAQVVVAVIPAKDPDFSVADTAKVVRLFEPQVVIPLSLEAASDNQVKLLAELGSTEPRTESVFKTKDLATMGEVLQIIVLEN